jgi:hypothetical protein
MRILVVIILIFTLIPAGIGGLYHFKPVEFRSLETTKVVLLALAFVGPSGCIGIFMSILAVSILDEEDDRKEKRKRKAQAVASEGSAVQAAAPAIDIGAGDQERDRVQERFLILPLILFPAMMAGLVYCPLFFAYLWDMSFRNFVLLSAAMAILIVGVGCTALQSKRFRRKLASDRI